ncbi:MAG: class I SAM-dependent methyltransferase, partial [Burkholderiales bacterium]|nr:class I SAM-dependent methyltransferase [Burkholderiales bacterium]
GAMIGSVMGKVYRGLVARIFGLETLLAERLDRTLEERLPGLIRGEFEGTLRRLFAEGMRPRVSLDVEQTAYFMAAVSSAEYFLSNMRMARNLEQSGPLIRFAMEQCTVDGLVLEFGVYQGTTLRVIADHTSAMVYGFDSFQGLPEDWTHFQQKGRFSLGGRLPQFEQPNVSLVPGWFEDTLPAFLTQHPEPARFVHVDSDLYSSAVTVLHHLRPRIVPGTVILFDEYFNYPGWQHHEYRAFQEFVRDGGFSYEYLGFASSHQSVAVRIT